MLFVMQGDGEYHLVIRRGRFAVERELAASMPHLEAAVREMQDRMIDGLRRKGYEFVGPDFELRGPVPHVEFADSPEADPGPTAAPDPRDTDAWQRWERAERARKARALGPGGDLVDYLLVARFKRKVHDTRISTQDPARYRAPTPIRVGALTV